MLSADDAELVADVFRAAIDMGWRLDSLASRNGDYLHISLTHPLCSGVSVSDAGSVQRAPLRDRLTDLFRRFQDMPIYGDVQRFRGQLSRGPLLEELRVVAEMAHVSGDEWIAQCNELRRSGTIDDKEYEWLVEVRPTRD